MKSLVNPLAKGKSPFTPGQPVPLELFVGRAEQIERIRQRGIRQVEEGKPVAMFVEGEYGIGKSSMANYVQRLAEAEHNLLSVYTALGTLGRVEEVGPAVTEAALLSGVQNSRLSERIKDWVAKYIKEITFFGVHLDPESLKRDAPTTARGLLAFLGEVVRKAKPAGIRGIFLVLDEINGLTTLPEFARFIKTLVDENALSRDPVPLLLMLCGIEERRREMILRHQPVERVFDVIPIAAMSEGETWEFFSRAFGTVNMRVAPEARRVLTHWSAGLPKIMHLIGDSAYWIDKDGVISLEDAEEAVRLAAEDVGKKYVDQQVYSALRSKDYLSILSKIVQEEPVSSFSKAEVRKRLTAEEQKKFDNFLQRMKKLNVLRPGGERGQYVFNLRMVPLYVWLQTIHRRRRSGRENSRFGNSK